MLGDKRRTLATIMTQDEDGLEKTQPIAQDTFKDAVKDTIESIDPKESTLQQ